MYEESKHQLVSNRYFEEDKQTARPFYFSNAELKKEEKKKQNSRPLPQIREKRQRNDVEEWSARPVPFEG